VLQCTNGNKKNNPKIMPMFSACVVDVDASPSLLEEYVCVSVELINGKGPCLKKEKLEGKQCNVEH
jgi:hypothetical protein